MMFQAEEQSYYDVLDLKPDATTSDIRQAYFRAKSAYSKDSAALYSLFDEQETKGVLETIEQAYIVLSNPEKRKEYDKVHGFFSTETTLPVAKKAAPPQGGVFSFDKITANAATALSPAEDAARMVLGESALPNPPANDVKIPRFEDYSTPRTLESANFSAAAVTESSTTQAPAPKLSPDLMLKNTRLGHIRRIDLVKNYSVDAVIEDEITTETKFQGPFLRKVREYRGISVEELSEFTKISKTYLNCIESEDFENLPAPAYLRGFVIQVAKALKLPHDKAAVGYMENYKNSVNK